MAALSEELEALHPVCYQFARKYREKAETFDTLKALIEYVMNIVYSERNKKMRRIEKANKLLVFLKIYEHRRGRSGYGIPITLRKSILGGDELYRSIVINERKKRTLLNLLERRGREHDLNSIKLPLITLEEAKSPLSVYADLF